MQDEKKSFKIDEIKPLDIRVSYVECTNTEIKPDDAHMHDKCEIYINLSGDLAFEVEGLVYPISPGSVIITRPAESHHCIYRSDALHKHYCIWFSAEGNERLFPAFFDRESGEENMYVFKPDSFASLIAKVAKLMNSESEVERVIAFFSIIDKICTASEDNASLTEGLPEDVALAVTYINENISAKITIKDLAEVAKVNITTLERHFFSIFGVSPREYLKKRRLNDSAKLLRAGKSVTETCYLCGFSDLSKFISSFKSHFGITPKQYQKNMEVE